MKSTRSTVQGPRREQRAGHGEKGQRSRLVPFGPDQSSSPEPLSVPCALSFSPGLERVAVPALGEDLGHMRMLQSGQLLVGIPETSRHHLFREVRENLILYK